MALPQNVTLLLPACSLLSDVVTIVKPLLFTAESSVSLSNFKAGSSGSSSLVVVKSYVKQKLSSLQREQVRATLCAETRTILITFV